MDGTTEIFQPLQGDDPPAVAGYRLAARLGAGGMGRVYLSHTPGGRPVAIKVVRAELADDPAFRHRFRREIKAAQRVRGAYTAELIDADPDGTTPWLATVYVPGPSLAAAVARRGPLPVPAVLWLVAGVAEALQAIHGTGIVHRDLKPSNVLLAADGPRVIDFGISLAADLSSHTVTGTAVGTPAYMAPEQAAGDDVTAATDVFALGQTAAFAALGRPLYGDGTAVGVLYRIVHSKPDLSLLPEQLRPLIARCLEADPARRATPAELVDWCRQRLGGDAGAAAGPEVWREIAGPEVAVPPPVADPTPVVAPLVPGPPPTGAPSLADPPTVPDPGQPSGQAPPDSGRSSAYTSPFAVVPPRAAPPERRGRRALIAGCAVVAAAVALVLIASPLRDAVGGVFDREASASSPPRSTAPEGESAGEPEDSPAPEAASETRGDETGDQGSGDQESPSAPASSTAPARPTAVPYPQQWLDEKNSLNIGGEPGESKDRRGDIRLVCGESCGLESDTSVITLLFDKPGATLDTCRTALSGATAGKLPLAAAAAGSEICVKHSSGTIALLVIQVKSTALPDAGINFVSADMTVWRAA